MLSKTGAASIIASAATALSITLLSIINRLDAVMARDFHVVIAAVTCSTVLLVVGNLCADGLLYLADPRIRTGVP